MTGTILGQGGDEPGHVDHAVVHVPPLQAPPGRRPEAVEERLVSLGPGGQVIDPCVLAEVDALEPCEAGVEARKAAAEQARLARKSCAAHCIEYTGASRSEERAAAGCGPRPQRKR